ncbi:MAG: hypothetical protein IMF16_04635 [Proteobacteria bacterium]|nr:hypothetical protein [Pseudomonadota bacterium]
MVDLRQRVVEVDLLEHGRVGMSTAMVGPEAPLAIVGRHADTVAGLGQFDVFLHQTPHDRL